MVAYRERDGLEKTVMVLSSIGHAMRTDKHRRKVQGFNLGFFAVIFVVLLTGETFFAAMMFSILKIEILGTVFSGAAFAMLVPTVICYAHVRLHHEADHFMRWWLTRLSGIGVLIFALGVSTMIGFSAWQAARDAVDVISSIPTGTLGSQKLGGGDNSSPSGIVEWISVVPNSLLFLGLSFGMIITISFASYCLGRALEAFNILTLTPRIGAEVKQRAEAATAKIAAFRKLRDRDTAARRNLPLDVKVKFARLAAHAGWKVGQTKVATARRVFDPLTNNDPLGEVRRDPVAGTIPGSCKTADDFNRHMAEQMDAIRAHNVLRVITGIPEAGNDTI